MAKPLLHQYPAACRAAGAICHGLPYPLNVSRVLDTVETHQVFDVSSQTYNRARGTGERLCPSRAWTLYSEQLDTYLIVWNAARSPEQIRYSVAHELGHILLNHQRAWPGDRPLMKREQELEADAFARCLLAPCEAIWGQLPGRPFSAGAVARRFGIPLRAAQALRYGYEYWLMKNSRVMR